MRAVFCERFEGIGALRFGETAEPLTADDEVMIDVHAAPVSYMDYLMICGGYQLRPALPYEPRTDTAPAAALPPGGLLLVHDFMVDEAREGPRFAAWYLLGGMLDNPSAVCLTPAYVERVLRDAGFRVEKTEVMLAGITMLTKAVTA